MHYCLVLILAGTTMGSEPEVRLPRPSADEPRAEQLSLARAGSFLDNVALSWLGEKKCNSCHTTYAYLMARPLLGDPKAPALLQVRKFFEERAAGMDGQVEEPLNPDGSEGITEVVATATTLAFYDAHSTHKLHPLTRKALDRMWTLQRPDGSWNWNKHQLPPQEFDEYYGAVFAALGVGYAPEGYAAGASAQAGLTRLRQYLARNPAPNLHHKTLLLWAALKLDGLMSKEERDQTVKQLLALQRGDGGWSLPSLGDWKRLNGRPNDRDAPSDGYATGLILYVLHEAGLPATAEPVRRGLTWLKANQRASGRWFTRSVNADRAHYISNAGTAYAVLALTAWASSEK
jgi:squalene-hopene/tetraprenyl-beta-curcumene cyclase